MLKYFLLAAFIQILWGFTPTASQIVLGSLPVEGYSAIRYTVSGFIFLIYSMIKNGRLKIPFGSIPLLALLGILTYAIDSLGTLYGLKIGGALNFAFASSLNAIITATLSIWLLKEKVSANFVFAAGLSVVGGLLLLLGKYDLSNFQIAAGSLGLIWGTYIFEALGFIFSKKFNDRIPLAEYIATLQLSAAAFMWILSACTNHLPAGLTEMPFKAWFCLIYVCLISCAFCYFLLYWLLGKMDGHKLAFFDCFHSITAAVFAAGLLGEPFNAKMLVGAGLLLVGLFVVNR